MAEKTNDELDAVERGRFDLLMNASGNIMLAFHSIVGNPENPSFVYDGRSRGILCKNKKTSPLPFVPLPKEAWFPLNKAKTILCVEVADERIVQQYMAKVEVKK